MTLYKLKHGILVIKVVAVRSNGIYCTYKIIIELFQIIQWRCMHLQQNWLAERDEDIIFCEWLVSFELLLYFRWFLYICCNFWIKLSLWVNWFENKFSSKTLHILNLLLFWKFFRKKLGKFASIYGLDIFHKKTPLEYPIDLWIVDNFVISHFFQMYHLWETFFPVRSFGETSESSPAGPTLQLPGVDGLRNAVATRPTLAKHSEQRRRKIVHQKRKHRHLEKHRSSEK